MLIPFVVFNWSHSSDSKRQNLYSCMTVNFIERVYCRDLSQIGFENEFKTRFTKSSMKYFTTEQWR